MYMRDRMTMQQTFISQSISSELSKYLASLEDECPPPETQSNGAHEMNVGTSKHLLRAASAISDICNYFVFSSISWSLDDYGSHRRSRMREWLFRADKSSDTECPRRPMPMGLAAVAIFSLLFVSLYILRCWSVYVVGTYQIGWVLILVSTQPFVYAYFLSTYVYSVWKACMRYRNIVTNTLIFARRVNLITMGVRTASTSLPPYTRAEEDWESTGYDELAAFGSLKKAKYMVALSILRISNCLSNGDDKMAYINCDGIVCSDALLRRLDSLVNKSIPCEIMKSYKQLLDAESPIVSTILKSVSLLMQIKRFLEVIEREISVLRVPPNTGDNVTKLASRSAQSSVPSEKCANYSFLLDELPKMIDVISKIRSVHELLATESWIYQQDLLLALHSLQHNESQDNAEQVLLRVLRFLRSTEAEGEKAESHRARIDVISSHWQSLEARLIHATLMWLERNTFTSSEAKELLGLLSEKNTINDIAMVSNSISVTSENSFRTRILKEEYSAIPDESSDPIIHTNRSKVDDPNVLIVDVFSGVVTGSDVTDSIDQGKSGDFFSDPMQARALLHELALHVRAFRGGVRVMERENGNEPVPVELFPPIEVIRPQNSAYTALEQISNITSDPLQMSKLNQDVLSSFVKMNRAPESSYMLGSSSDDE